MGSTTSMGGELTKLARVYAACGAFGTAFLITSFRGGHTYTALLRGIVVAAATYLVVGWLLRPVVSAVLDAMARDSAAASPRKESAE